MEKDYPIDIVLTWVDGNDPNWLQQKKQYVSESDNNNKSIAGSERYIDDGLLKYIFRGIEVFLPWVNKIHFVTWGHLPKWLNISNPKLHIVNHKDYMPSSYLPTFASNSLSLNFHRIPGLAEHFIYVNDDMYFIKPTKKSLFFKKGLPCDMAVQEIVDDYEYQDVYYYSVHNDLALLNRLINKKYSISHNFFKWFSFKYGIKYFFKNMCLSPFNLFSGIYEPHTPAPYLKSTFIELWETIEEQLNDTSLRKTRSPYNCSENIFRYYQMGKGAFYPINRDKYGRLFVMSSKGLPETIRQQKYNMICINYSDKNSTPIVEKAFDSILPIKSSFEK